MTFLTSPEKSSKQYLKLYGILKNGSYHVTLNNLISCKTKLNIPNSIKQSINYNIFAPNPLRVSMYSLSIPLQNVMQHFLPGHSPGDVVSCETRCNSGINGVQKETRNMKTGPQNMQYILTLQHYGGLECDPMHFGRYETSTSSRAAFLMPVQQIHCVTSEQILILIFTVVEVSEPHVTQLFIKY